MASLVGSVPIPGGKLAARAAMSPNQGKIANWRAEKRREDGSRNDAALNALLADEVRLHPNSNVSKAFSRLHPPAAAASGPPNLSSIFGRYATLAGPSPPDPEAADPEAAEARGRAAEARGRAAAAAAAEAAYKTAPYWEPKDRIPFRQLVDLEDELRSRSNELAMAEDGLKLDPKNEKLYKATILTTSTKLRKAQLEHARLMDLYFKYPGHFNDWDWRHRGPDHIQGQGNLYVPGVLAPYYTNTPTSKNISGFNPGDHIKPILPSQAVKLPPELAAQRNQDREIAKALRLTEVIQDQVTNRAIPQISAAEEELRLAQEELNVAQRSFNAAQAEFAAAEPRALANPLAPRARAELNTARRHLNAARPAFNAATRTRRAKKAALNLLVSNTQNAEKAIRNKVTARKQARRNNKKAVANIGPVNLNAVASNRNAQNHIQAINAELVKAGDNIDKAYSIGSTASEETKRKTMEVRRRLEAMKEELVDVQRRYNEAHAPGSKSTEATKEAARAARDATHAQIDNLIRSVNEKRVNSKINTMFD